MAEALLILLLRPLAALLVLAAVSEAAVPAVNLGSCGRYATDGHILSHILGFVAKVALEEGFLDDVVRHRSEFSTVLTPVDTYCRAAVGKEASELVHGTGLSEGRLYSSTRSSPPSIGILGCWCSSASLVVARLATSFEVPMVSPSATSPELSKKHLYPYFSRTIAPDSQQGAGIASIVITFGWRLVQLIEVEDPYTQGVSDAFRASLAEQGGQVVVFRDLVRPMPLLKVEDVPGFNYTLLQELAGRVSISVPARRIFVAPGGAQYIIPIVRAFDEAGLFMHATVWLLSEVICSMAHLSHATSLLSSSFGAAWPHDPLFASPSSIETWKVMPQRLLGMLCLQPDAHGPRFDSPSFFQFWTSLTRAKLLRAGMPSSYPTQDWWFANLTKLSSDPFYTLAFDAMTALFVAIGDMIHRGTPVEQVYGARFAHTVRAVHFEGLSGTVVFDEWGDRLAPYSIRNLQRAAPDSAEGGLQLVRVGQYNSDVGTVTFDAKAIFSDGSDTPPPDTTAACSTGFQYNGQTQLCEPCSAGKAAPRSGLAPCEVCFPGFFAPGMGMSACLLAPAGRYVPTAGMAWHLPCPAGTHQAETGQSDCVRCSRGTYSIGNASTCTHCAVGSYADQEGADSCILCPIPGSVTRSPRAEGLSECVCSPGMTLVRVGPLDHLGFCESCPDGFICEGFTHAHPKQAERHHLGVPSYQDGRPPYHVLCKTASECPSGRELGQCGDRRTGVGCSHCVDGFYLNERNRCQPCDLGSATIALMIIIGALALASGGIFTYRGTNQLLSKRALDTSGVICCIIINALQSLGVMSGLQTPWVEPIGWFVRTLGAVNARMGMERLDCIYGQPNNLNAYIRDLALYPSLALCVCLLAWLQKCLGWEILLVTSICNTQGTLLTVAYLQLVQVSLAPWQCVTNPDGSSSLHENRSVICYEGPHIIMLCLSVLAILIYVVGVLAVVVRATILYPGMVQRNEGTVFLRNYKWLFRRLSKSRYYFGIVFVVRNVLIAGSFVAFVNHPEEEVLLVVMVILAYAGFQARWQPWHSPAANIVDTVLSVSLVMLLSAACLMFTVKDSARYVVGYWLFFMVAASLLTSQGFLLWALVYACCWSRRRKYGVFLSHHKAGAAVLARWFKLYISVLIQNKVFYDCDDLRSLDSLVDIVANHTQNLIVLLTRDTLWRIWCAGEIAAAIAADVHIVPVRCQDDWVMLTDEELQRIGPCWTQAQLVEVETHGITVEGIRVAYRRFGELSFEDFSRRAKPEAQKEQLAAILSQCRRLRWKIVPILRQPTRLPSRQPSGSPIARSPTSASHQPSGTMTTRASTDHQLTLILTDPSRAVSLHIAMVLECYLRQLPVSAEAHHEKEIQVLHGSIEECGVTIARADHALVVLTNGVLESEVFLGQLAQVLHKGTVRVLPLVADERFRYPDRQFYFLLRPEFRVHAMDAYLSLFTVFAVRFSPEASERIQLAEVKEVAARLAAAQPLRMQELGRTTSLQLQLLSSLSL